MSKPMSSEPCIRWTVLCVVPSWSATTRFSSILRCISILWCLGRQGGQRGPENHLCSSLPCSPPLPLRRLSSRAARLLAAAAMSGTPMDEEAPTLDAGPASQPRKKRVTAGGTVDLVDADDKLTDLMGNLALTVGEGEYNQPMMMGILQAVTETARDVADLRTAMIRSYEGPVQWSYATLARRCLQSYAEEARRVKGTQTNLGPPKNYAAVGLAQAVLEDKAVPKEDRAALKDILRGRVLERAAGGSSTAEKVTLSQAKKMEDVVLYCQVTVGKKKSYVNLHCSDSPAGQQFANLLERALLLEGRRQWEAPPLKPVHRDLRSAMLAARGSRPRGGAAS